MGSSSTSGDTPAQILSGTPGRAGAYLHVVRDGLTGQWLAPAQDSRIALPADFAYRGKGVRTAIIDTGMLLEHPWISRCLVESVDLTGEGPNDLNGHGTCTTLIYLTIAPESEVVNIKALDSLGRGTRGSLIAALDWVGAKLCPSVNMSCGVYTPGCHGDCDLCQKAIQVAANDIKIAAAVGNQAGLTACPAKVGMLGGPVFAVGAVNLDTHELEPYSGVVGEGFVAAGTYSFVPINIPPEEG